MIYDFVDYFVRTTQLLTIVVCAHLVTKTPIDFWTCYQKIMQYSNIMQVAYKLYKNLDKNYFTYENVFSIL